MTTENESLFSLEVAVKTIYLKQAIVCRVPKVSVRMLDYPTLDLPFLTDEEFHKIRSITEQEPETLAQTPQLVQLQHSTGTYAFTQGKSMLIKIKLSHLEQQLLTVPVYILVMDVLPELPKLVASFALSLESTIRKIVKSVSLNGIEAPCSHGERDVFPLYNLMGSKVGEAEMGVRLSSLGVNMLQHVTNIAKPGVHNHMPFPTNIEHSHHSSEPELQKQSRKSQKDRTDDPHSANKDRASNEDKENAGRNKTVLISGSTQTVIMQKYSKSVQYHIPDYEDGFTIENTYCPPALFYDKRSDAMEKELLLKQHQINSETLQQRYDQRITLADLQRESERGISKVPATSKPPGEDAVGLQSQKEATSNYDVTGALANFPVLRALVEEVTRLGLGDNERALTRQKKQLIEPKKDEKRKPSVKKRSLKLSAMNNYSSKEKSSKPKGTLKFGLTNTMRLRMALNKDRMKNSEMAVSRSRESLPHKSTSSSLGRTYNVKTPRPSKQKRLVSTACGPDNSMYRRAVNDVRPQTVYMGKMGEYEEGTDLDVPSIDHISPDTRQTHEDNDDDFIQELMIVKDIGTPRAHSRQSQRSIEIHLPTASTEFTIGKDDDPDWASTFSDRDRLLERHRRKGSYYDEDSDSESDKESKAGSMVKVGRGKKTVTISQSLDRSEAVSDMYKYSDDFEDDKTWSANPTPVASSLVLKDSVDDSHDISPDRTANTAAGPRSSAGAESRTEKQQSQKSGITSDEAHDTSSASYGSVITARPAKSHGEDKRGVRLGTGTAPEPIQCDSPVGRSINTDDSIGSSFPDPSKVSLTGKSALSTQKSSGKEVNFPDATESLMLGRWDPPAPKPSRFTPSPPTSRRYSPVSSPESSKDRMRRMYRRPGRRHRHASLESLSSEFEKPVSPVRRSDSVSSYLPSDVSEMSNVRMSEDLSDILSEDTDSQDESRSVKKKNRMPRDGPKTYFGMPKLDPANKLGYTK